MRENPCVLRKSKEIIPGELRRYFAKLIHEGIGGSVVRSCGCANRAGDRTCHRLEFERAVFALDVSVQIVNVEIPGASGFRLH